MMRSTQGLNAHSFSAAKWIDHGAIQLTAPLTELLKQWEQERLLTPLDRHFALEMSHLHPSDSQQPLFMLLCALLSQQLSSQHSCLVLAHIVPLNPMAEQNSHCKISLSLEALTETLQTFDAVGQAGSNKPLIFDNGRLYLQRYHQFETSVAASLIRLSGSVSKHSEDVSHQEQTQTAKLRSLLDQLFPANVSDPHSLTRNAITTNVLTKSEGTQNAAPIDWQKVATATALGKKLAVITGGPGTGKTTTVTKLLLLLQMESMQEIRLVAPTGKAAARLSESIKASKARLAKELSAHADDAHNRNSQDFLTALGRIPEEASTLHRLLGVIPNSPHFRHHQGNPLRLDLLIVDEASMVDLPMMYKLLSALPEHASLILLGDQDQLASVEAGAVLADICAGLKMSVVPNNLAQNNIASNNPALWQMRYSKEQAERLSALTDFELTPFISDAPKLGDSLCMLMHSHRFKGDAGIGLLASAVNLADLQGILQVWQQGPAELSWLEHSMVISQTQAKVSEPANNVGLNLLLEQACQQYGVYLSALNSDASNNDASNSDLGTRPSTADIIESFNQYRILCAMRSGDYGVEGINQYVTQALANAKLIKPLQEFYLGRPIIIQSNDYNLGLFNGDIGLILQDEDKPERLMAHFIKADGSLLKVLPARLPSHETCYAMTVHKSQGSEFSRVALVLPPNPSLAQWQLLTKELIYTAITRAKVHFTCLGTQHVFERASSQATQRASGLADRLWG
ncbi:exodeoxyribonuclease V subunit alpha [Shewanella baltica]|uniref:exodeoxyribonuclease V subunit alpha n=1 Tax=Shewanella baltica TaxID=62322 RepID=UPI00217D73E9|nr:exodeoxyribonuclease V subunit alpha [Shewanella baltica]MCS6129487.1 exodeoxyribonuclease V subunit alpha [Shewanella baltica]MCS6141275.1 exodeoxyribonuclease V subunit alpha [Shewanella baltica]MCS6147559.1 exodeoxyribonuclease V subunit alpha [Shewanella baltica]MCS6172088.1 exodeoxyribonuclease V subunit alpha [Shewanella baltica]MCS6189313.1 exodeoxyribonuclease V subunit alpha [Shewanella baltica]